MQLSIIIVNYNSKDVIRNCLLSLAKIKVDVELEVFIIDNDSSESIRDLEATFPLFNFIYNDKNLGFAAANNIGIKKAKGKYILLLNPDTIVNENSFQPMISYLEKHDDVGIVGCKIYNADGDIEKSTHSFPSLLKNLFMLMNLLRSFWDMKAGFPFFSGKYLNQNLWKVIGITTALKKLTM